MSSEVKAQSNHTENVWLTWQDHPRSRTLSREFSAQYVVFKYSGFNIFRYLILSFKTLYFLLKFRPKVVFCQNPSMVLNALLCLFKPLFKYFLVADRHTNFAFRHASSFQLKWIIFRAISNYNIRNSDIMIVTNDFLKKYIDCLGGNGFVLPDKIPSLAHGFDPITLKGKFNCFFVCTFSDDEPYAEVFEAARKVPANWYIYVSGNFKKLKMEKATIPENIVLLGFLEDEEYIRYLRSADCVMVLTTLDFTLNCGAYEAVAAKKPMILSDKETIRNYFNKGAVYSGSRCFAIEESLRFMFQKSQELQPMVEILKLELEEDWRKRFDLFEISGASQQGDSE